MSGGHFDYIQYRISNVADDVKKYIDHCEGAPVTEDDDNYYDPDYRPEYPEEILAKFRECEKHLRLAAVMLHEMDWRVSGDTGDESFTKRWNEKVAEVLKLY